MDTKGKQLGYVPLVVRDTELANCDIGHCLETLRSFSQSKVASLCLHGKLHFSFPASAAENRPLFTVPAVRNFVRSIDREWQEWLYFMCPGNQQLLFLELCLVDMRCPEQGEWRFNRVQLEHNLRVHALAAKTFALRLGRSEEEIESFTKAALNGILHELSSG